ncbi:hypothetical protein DES36_11917 [Alkalibaculum bacchi]|uniref:Uncharacterized protein n=1 Tax=Alkalibaculum bacchi TaxID=645887 RepID=A0A366HYT7_9FIRM|nr:hypothetical protein DES36_11917 [Alkalibaculum bacchi]
MCSFDFDQLFQRLRFQKSYEIRSRKNIRQKMKDYTIRETINMRKKIVLLRREKIL